MKNLKMIRNLIIPFIFIYFFSCKDDIPVPDEFIMPSKVVSKIVIDDNGVKWFATDKGIVSYDGSEWTAYTENQLLSNEPVTDLAFEYGSGIKKLWLAGNDGVSSLEPGTTPIPFVNYNTKNSGILSDTVRALGVDESNTKYVGTLKGMSILKDNKWSKFYGRKGEEILKNYKISGVVTAKNGWIYAATQGGGVSRFQYTDAVSGATTFNLPWAGGLQSDNILTVELVDDNYQWYGTDRGVALHTSEFTKSDWTSYSRADGLICDTVYAICKDISGNVWFGTHRGVSKLSGTNWENYTDKDGLISNKVNTIAVDLDGSVWFGTDEGISHFINNKWEN